MGSRETKQRLEKYLAAIERTSLLIHQLHRQTAELEHEVRNLLEIATI